VSLRDRAAVAEGANGPRGGEGGDAVSEGRWRTAQGYERGYWAAQAEMIASGAVSELDWYRWRADQLVLWLRERGEEHLTEGDARVIEVGSGPVGLSAFFPAVVRVAVDPLATFFAANRDLTRHRDPEVDYREGVGEALPAGDAAFDLGIIENCIDHVQDSSAVLGELARVLRPGGVLYLTVNGRSAWWGYPVHRILSRLRLDPGHPHTFTTARARDFVRRHGFELLDCRAGSYRRALLDDLRSPGFRPRLKAALGVSEYLISILAVRSPA
jgi:SAM-dependent methyltransferase